MQNADSCVVLSGGPLAFFVATSEPRVAGCRRRSGAAWGAKDGREVRKAKTNRVLSAA